jgi:DNA-binding IclR family transcriptional regulator
VSGGLADKAESAPSRRGGRGSIQSVERAGRVLRLLGDNGPQSVTELAAAMTLPKGTVHGVLQALVSTGLVQQDADSQGYALGPALVYLGSRYLLADEVRLCAGRWARSLAKQTNHVVQVGTLHGAEVLIVNHVGRTDDSGYVPDLGSLYPAHTTATGKVLLANNDAARTNLLGAVAGDQKRGNDVVPRSELDRVVDQRWAVASERDWLGEASMACPIANRLGMVVASVGVVGSSEQLLVGEEPRREVLERVLAAAAGISRDLGGRGW